MAVGAVAVSSTSDSPLPEPGLPLQDPAAKALALPPPKPQTNSAISMTAALKNVGAVSVHLCSSKQYCEYVFLKKQFKLLCLADYSS